MENGRGPGFLWGISFRTLWRTYSAPDFQLTEEEQHVVDLRLIVVTILGLLGIYFFIYLGQIDFYKPDHCGGK